MDNIRIQEEDFDLSQEQKRLLGLSSKIGSVVTFTGLVRDFEGSDEIDCLSIQHYPGMTEKLLREILEQANARWSLLGTTVVHRFGSLLPSQQIVLVAVASEHRGDAFQAAQFIMDYLKTKATLWKRVVCGQDSYWINAKGSDVRATSKWNEIHDRG